MDSPNFFMIDLLGKHVLPSAVSRGILVSWRIGLPSEALTLNVLVELRTFFLHPRFFISIPISVFGGFKRGPIWLAVKCFTLVRISARTLHL